MQTQHWIPEALHVGQVQQPFFNVESEVKEMQEARALMRKVEYSLCLKKNQDRSTLDKV